MNTAGKCSDITGNAAAALAHASVAFADNTALSQRYFEAAGQVYAMTSARVATSPKIFGNSNAAYSLLQIYYPSSGVTSHVFYAAASMWSACLARSCPDEAKLQADARKCVQISTL